MNTPIRPRLRYVMVMLAGLAAASGARADPPASPPRPPTPAASYRNVQARGTCVALVAPDRGRLTIWTQRTEPGAGQASAEATTALAALRNRLAALHLADAAFESDGVQIDKQQIEGPKGPVGFTYQARAGLQLETSDIAGLGRALDAAGTADQIAPLAVYVSEARREQAIDDCLPKAAAAARRHAQALLSGLGETLGPAQHVDGFLADGGEAPSSDLFGGGRPMMVARMATPQAAVSAVDRRIEVSTTVSFAIGTPAP